jgi:hypothetical protein
MVATVVAMKPIFSELPKAEQTSGAPQGLSQLEIVKPRQTRLLLPALLNEKAIV